MTSPPLNPAVVSPLIGARTFAGLEDNPAAPEPDFSDDQTDRLDAASRGHPCFAHTNIASDLTFEMFGGVKVVMPHGR